MLRMGRMAVVAHLLGRPFLVRDDVVYPAPRGRKVWALLAYLASTERPPTRQELIDLLFTEAEDPAGALRWNLSQLRKLLGGPETVGSATTVKLRLPEGSVVDARVLSGGTSREAVDLPGLGRELLEGMDVDASPGFTAWLLGERRRLQALSEAVLREGALRALAVGNAQVAIDLATRLVAMDPLNEDAHVLLIRAFAGTGDEVAVERQLSASNELFRRELGVEPGPELAEAAILRARPAAGPEGAGGRAGARAMLEAGEAAVAAGVIGAGLDELRRAVAASADAGDRDLEAEALLALGAALVHATKERDEEGAAALHRCIAVADATSQRAMSASAHRELGYIEVLRGAYGRAWTWLREAERLAAGDEVELARVRAVTAVCHADIGSHDRAIDAFDESIALSGSTGQTKQRAWSMAVLGRTHLLRNDLQRADEVLAQARELTKNERWTAFLAYPEALSAEVSVRRGDLDAAGEAFEHAFALGCRVNDACWEAYGARGLGLLRAARGDLQGAVETLEDALSRSARQRDTHLWVRAYVLDSLCAVAVGSRHPLAGRWVTDLASISGRSGMRELSVRAYLYRRELGDPSATDAARTLAAGIENPHLQELIELDAPTLLHDLVGAARVHEASA